MPYVRKRKYVKKRRPFRGRRRYGKRNYTKRSSNLQVVSRGGFLPLKTKRVFKYAEKISINPPLGGLSSSYFYSTNSLYDPNRTGAGHQPLGYDEMMELYDHYTVIGSKITVTAICPTSATTDPVILAITERDTSATPTASIEHLIEQGNSTYVTLGQRDGGSGVQIITHQSNPSKFLGRSKPMADPQMKGSISSSPAEESFYEINVASFSNDDPPSINLLVNIEYIAVLTEPKKFLQS